MPFIFNGVEMKTVVFNGADMQTALMNGTEIYQAFSALWSGDTFAEYGTGYWYGIDTSLDLFRIREVSTYGNWLTVTSSGLPNGISNSGGSLSVLSTSGNTLQYKFGTYTNYGTVTFDVSIGFSGVATAETATGIMELETSGGLLRVHNRYFSTHYYGAWISLI